MTRVVAAVYASILLLALVIIIGNSIVRVNDDEVCQAYYKDDTADDTVEVFTSPGLYWVGPENERNCVTRATQHLTFSHETDAGLGRSITVHSVDGISVRLEVDIEFRIVPERFEETVQRVGFDERNQRLMQTARSKIRDVASEFRIESFLIGTRENISTRILTVYREELERDRIHVNVIKVNLLHIDVDDAYETLFQQTEDIRLQQITARQQPALIRINEERLNETQSINLEAQRNRDLQQARSATAQAQLAQARQITEADTAFQRRRISAESARNVAVIRADTELGRVIGIRPVRIGEVTRAATANRTLAETERQNMEVIALNNISLAHSNRTRDIQIAQTNRTRQLERITTRAIEFTLRLFQIDLEANTTAAERRFDGYGAANETLAAERAVATEWNTIKTRLNLTDHQLATVVLHKTLARAGNATVTLDWQAQPLRLAEGNPPGFARASLAVA